MERLYQVELSYKTESAYRRNRSINVIASNVIEAANKAEKWAGTDHPDAHDISIWAVHHKGSIDVK